MLQLLHNIVPIHNYYIHMHNYVSYSDVGTTIDLTQKYVANY